MMKTFETTKSPHELRVIMTDRWEHPEKYGKEKHSRMIRVLSPSRVQVSEGRGATQWDLDFYENNYITATKNITSREYLLIAFHGFALLIATYLIFSDGFSFGGLCVLALFAVFEELFRYFTYFFLPMISLGKYINEYLR